VVLRDPVHVPCSFRVPRTWTGTRRIHGTSRKKFTEVHGQGYIVINILNYRVKDRAEDMIKNRANKKHYSPAYYRYHENHPTVTVVLTRELKEVLDSQKRDTAMPYSQLIKKFINQQCDEAKARTEAYTEGYNKALDKYRQIRIGKCSCGKPLVFNLENPNDLKILNDAITESPAVHEGCKPKPLIFHVPIQRT
jgi:predicted DNA binding CopG/RHH family protein